MTIFLFDQANIQTHLLNKSNLSTLSTCPIY